MNSKNLDTSAAAFSAPTPATKAKLPLIVTGLTIKSGFYNEVSQCFVDEIRENVKYLPLKESITEMLVETANGWEEMEVTCMDANIAEYPINNWYDASWITLVSCSCTIGFIMILIWLCCTDWCRCCCCPKKTALATNGHVYV